MRVLLVSALVLFATGAQAQQTIVINPRPPAPAVSAQAQRVTINITIVNAVPTGPGAGELTAGFAAANRGLFSVVDHECDVLAPLLNGECRLVGMTTNGNSNERPNFGAPGGTPAISVSANASYEIILKPGQPANK